MEKSRVNYIMIKIRRVLQLLPNMKQYYIYNNTVSSSRALKLIEILTIIENRLQ